MVTIHNIGVRVTGTWDVSRLTNIEVWNASAGSNVPDTRDRFSARKK